jgi:purine-nucleoside phosphorylase
MNMPLQDAIDNSAARLRASGITPQIAVVLGTGWGPLAERVQGAIDIPYRDLPAFPVLGVGGHAGQVRLGTLGGRPVAVLAGRKHAYETGEPDGMKGAIRTLAAIGVKVLVQTNASGSMDPGMRPGELMLITDHINVVQRSPLVNQAGDDRFVDMSAAYDPALCDTVRCVARAQGITLHEGVYAWVLGPQFETPAEIRWLRSTGAQAVGMSTVPETILARHAKMRVLALSMFTNMAAGMSAEDLSHAHTMATAKTGSDAAVRLLEAAVAALEL